MPTHFKKLFGESPVYWGFTPGRVNIIGEHTDYNGGMVLPTALALGINLSMSPRTDNKVRVGSDGFETLAERSLGESAQDHWSDYILGAVSMANEAGLMEGGANISAITNLPFGAGISSSAAVTVGVLKLAREHSNSGISNTDIAVLARRVENEFIGMPCGIMDQMAVAIAHPGQALALDTDTLDYDLIPLPDDFHVAVIHSGEYRKLSEGRYKKRKEQCDVVKAFLGRDDICKISDDEFKSLGGLELHIQGRAKHCMTEHRRTVDAVSALKSNDMNMLGHLMVDSHDSMRDDFDITLPSIDNLVEDAVKLGALGARMTGGGFGGCIVAIIAKCQFEDWQSHLLKQHPKAFLVA